MAEYHNKNNEFNFSWNSAYPSDYMFETNKMGNNSGTSLQTERMDDGSINISGCLYHEPAVVSQDPDDGCTGQLSSAQCDGTQCEFEEPPLLVELGIDTDRIIEKSVAVLNPFYSDVTFNVNIMYETDLAGLAALSILLGACLFLAGSKAHFSYVYGIVVIGCMAMYILLTLMTTEGSIPLGSVASILGYCLLPVVILSVLGIFLPLYGPVGFMCAALAVVWSSLSASKLFVMMSGDPQQRSLIAYPCVLLYGALVLAVVF